MKRRKDSGFTLIELMIVIAVIGILAIVLVPRVGTVKEQAKNAGLETNLKMVHAFAESRITYWHDKNRANTEIAADFRNAFTTPSGETSKIVNPHSNQNTIFDSINTSGTKAGTNALQILPTTETSDGKGAIAVIIPATVAELRTTGIVINSYDLNGSLYSTTTVKP